MLLSSSICGVTSSEMPEKKGCRVIVGVVTLLAPVVVVVELTPDKARLDLAGIRLDARRTAIEVERFTRVVSSASEIRSPAFTGTWQGTQEIEMGVLDLDP